MATFVIVHGAWSGGHAWRWVRPLVRFAGHEVFTPALTGLGERSHLASAQVDLETTCATWSQSWSTRICARWSWLAMATVAW